MGVSLTTVGEVLCRQITAHQDECEVSTLPELLERTAKRDARAKPDQVRCVSGLTCSSTRDQMSGSFREASAKELTASMNQKSQYRRRAMAELLHHGGRSYLDDRMYVLEVVRVIASRIVSDDPMRPVEGGPRWIVTTRRNVPGLPPTRTDDFDTREEAIAYMEEVEPTTPRVSLDGRPPEPTPTLAAHRRWLHENNLSAPYIAPAPDPSTKVFEVFRDDQLQNAIKRLRVEGLAWRQDAPVNITPEAAETFRWCIEPRQTPYLFFDWLDQQCKVQGVDFPWAVIALDRPYHLLNHCLAARGESREVLVAGIPLKNHADTGQELTTYVALRKEGLASLADRSPLFNLAWRALKDHASNRHWLCVLEPLEQEWAIANQDMPSSSASP